MTIPVGGRSSDSPVSMNLTVELWEKLGSKLAISGAMYCVAVSIRWVISPMKMKPRPEGQRSGGDYHSIIVLMQHILDELKSMINTRYPNLPVNHG